MSKTTTTEKKIRKNVLHELQKLTSENSPVLFKIIQTQKGYENLERVIISRVIKENSLPIEIIPQLEMEYGLEL